MPTYIHPASGRRQLAHLSVAAALIVLALFMLQPWHHGDAQHAPLTDLSRPNAHPAYQPAFAMEEPEAPMTTYIVPNQQLANALNLVIESSRQNVAVIDSAPLADLEVSANAILAANRPGRVVVAADQGGRPPPPIPY